MKHVKFAAVATLVAGLGFAVPAFAAEHGTKDEAIAMVNKAVAFIKAEGPDKAYAEFTNKNPKFVDRDLYVVVYRMNGTVMAHGANAKMVGKDLKDATDVDGKPYVKERLELAAAKGTFWQEYKFTNPVSKKIEPKEMYCTKLNDDVVCAGVYKQ
jgi:signal transduction histidine kinase